MYFASILLQNVVFGTQILMVAVGLYFVYASSRVLHLAVGAIGAAATYGLFWTLNLGWPIIFAVLFGAMVAVILSLLAAYLFEPFATKKEALMGLLASFALGIMIEAVLAMIFGTGGKNFQSGILPVQNFLGIPLDLPGVVTIYIGIALAVVSWIFVRFTRLGRTLRSVAENTILSVSLGINNRNIRILTYCLAGLVAAMAVSLTAWHRALTPLIGFHLIIQAFIALLMGGVNDLRGAVFSSYILAIIPGLIIGYTAGLSENWRLVIVFVIAALVLIVRPDGIFTKKVREA